MCSKIIIAIAMVALVQAYPHEEHYPDSIPDYTFKYSVEDPKTHDSKSQHETRHGDSVKGEYSLVEPDGTIRKVEYTADKHSGFVAHVTKSGHAVHPIPVKHEYVPVKYEAPVEYHHEPAVSTVYQHASYTPVEHYAPEVKYEYVPVKYEAPVEYHHAPAVSTVYETSVHHPVESYHYKK